MCNYAASIPRECDIGVRVCTRMHTLSFQQRSHTMPSVMSSCQFARQCERKKNRYKKHYSRYLPLKKKKNSNESSLAKNMRIRKGAFTRSSDLRSTRAMRANVYRMSRKSRTFSARQALDMPDWQPRYYYSCYPRVNSLFIRAVS